MEVNECYPVFRSCYEMLEALNEEKNLGLSQEGLMVYTLKLYTALIKAMQAANNEGREVSSVWELVQPFDIK